MVSLHLYTASKWSFSGLNGLHCSDRNSDNSFSIAGKLRLSSVLISMSWSYWFSTLVSRSPRRRRLFLYPKSLFVNSSMKHGATQMIQSQRRQLSEDWTFFGVKVYWAISWAEMHMERDRIDMDPRHLGACRWSCACAYLLFAVPNSKDGFLSIQYIILAPPIEATR